MRREFRALSVESGLMKWSLRVSEPRFVIRGGMMPLSFVKCLTKASFKVVAFLALFMTREPDGSRRGGMPGLERSLEEVYLKKDFLFAL